MKYKIGVAGLGIPGPEANSRSKLDPRTFFGMINQVVWKYPQIRIVATTIREVQSTNKHCWGAVNLGWAHGTLLTTYPGDTTMATIEQVRAFAKGAFARIQR